MKTVLLSINSKYVHTMPAARYLKAACSEFPIEVLEWNINQPQNKLFEKLFAMKPELVGISCYIFNIIYVREILDNIREILPGVKIVLGGPEVSSDAERYVDLADWIVCGEGEQAFYKILKERPKEKIIRGESVVNLNELPSPYVQEYIALGRDRILYYESSRGCPFSCSYCMSSRSGPVRWFSLDRVFSDLSTLMEERPMQIKFVDRTFNADRDRACRILEFLLQRYSQAGTNFHFEMAPELFSEELFSLFERVPKGMFQVEIGVQSFYEKALHACGRKADLNRVEENIQRISAMGNVHVHTDLIAGLPYETYEEFARSFDRLFACRPNVIQLGFLKLLKGSALRQEMDHYGYRCYQTPPYEIICNDFLSFAEVCSLKHTEAALERYYNSGRFIHSLNYLIPFTASPFSFFAALGNYLLKTGATETGISANRQCDLLYDFAADFPADRQVLAELINLDFAESGNVRRWKRKI